MEPLQASSGPGAALAGPVDLSLGLLPELLPGENLVLSPVSLAMLLALLLEGTEGDVREELRTALGVEDLDAVREGVRQTLGAWREADGEALRVTVAQALFHGIDLRPSSAYDERARSVYGASLIETDFARPRRAAGTINDWCARQTGDLVRHIVGPADFTASTLLVAANAVYFEGRWTRPFEKDRTEPGPFHRPDGSGTVEVPMMRDTRTLPWLDDPDAGFAAVTLPYAGDDGDARFAMTVVLPRPGRLDAVGGLLDRALLRRIRTDGSPRRVALGIPRVSAGTRTSLTAPLTHAGLGAFFEETDVLEGIFDGDVPARVDDLLHVARLVLDETGTEAAAVSTGLVELGAFEDTAEPVPFVVDRPYLMVVHDQETGAVLFCARIVDPRSGSGPAG